ncbi:MAG: nucleotide disphospho-sugar-binding domain-containing protein, partial [Pseudohongiellaceae bacterium]
MRALFAWELGRNFGHIAKLAGVARVLARRGWKIDLALQQPAIAKMFAADFPFTLHQAPFKAAAAPARSNMSAPAPVILSDGFLHCGYDNPDELTALIRGWQILFKQLQPDALITQAAPTAALASAESCFRRFSIGTGYDLVPLTDPLPALHYWKDVSLAVRQARDSLVTTKINAALDKLGMQRIDHVAQMLAMDKHFLCAFRELDHYPSTMRSGAEADYYGAIFATNHGKELTWNPLATSRIFAYLEPLSHTLPACVAALQNLPANHDIILVSLSLSEGLQRKISRPNLRVSCEPVRLGGLLSDADLVLSNGNSGTTNLVALQGVPQLVFPNHLEQFMMSRAASASGLAKLMRNDSSARQVRHAIDTMLLSSRYRKKAEAFAAKYAD